MSRIKTGGYAPLFDRLEQPHDNEKKIVQWLDIKNLERSVFNELNRITQTRSRLTFLEYLNKKNLTVLDYGLPDFYGFSTQNSDNRNKVTDVLKKAFTYFEPRLTKISIDHIVDNQSKSELKFQITGDLLANFSTEPVTFLISSSDSVTNSSLLERNFVD